MGSNPTNPDPYGPLSQPGAPHGPIQPDPTPAETPTDTPEEPPAETE